MLLNKIPKIITIAGPTGTGKSDLSLRIVHELAETGISAEIVNADAMQQYRGLNIGTAKLDVSQRQGIPHHLIDNLEITTESTAAQYRNDARNIINNLNKNNKVAVLVGGSGFYISSVLHDLEFQVTDADLRAELEQEFQEKGLENLVEKLYKLDKNAPSSIDTKNPRRVIRAIEVITLSEKPYLSSLPSENKPWRKYYLLGLFDSREDLVLRLDKRVKNIWEEGIIDETQKLLSYGLENAPTAIKAIGYMQAIEQIKGNISESDAIEQTQKATRRYARRQMSWFRRYPDIDWYNPNTKDLAKSLVKKILETK